MSVRSEKMLLLFVFLLQLFSFSSNENNFKEYKDQTNFDMTKLEKYVAALNVIDNDVSLIPMMTREFKTSGNALPFGIVKSDWSRLLLLRDFHTQRMNLTDKFEYLTRILIEAYLPIEGEIVDLTKRKLLISNISFLDRLKHLSKFEETSCPLTAHSDSIDLRKQIREKLQKRTARDAETWTQKDQKSVSNREKNELMDYMDRKNNEFHISNKVELPFENEKEESKTQKSVHLNFDSREEKSLDDLVNELDEDEAQERRKFEIFDEDILKAIDSVTEISEEDEALEDLLMMIDMEESYTKEKNEEKSDRKFNTSSMIMDTSEKAETMEDLVRLIDDQDLILESEAYTENVNILNASIQNERIDKKISENSYFDEEEIKALLRILDEEEEEVTSLNNAGEIDSLETLVNMLDEDDANFKEEFKVSKDDTIVENTNLINEKDENTLNDILKMLDQDQVDDHFLLNYTKEDTKVSNSSMRLLKENGTRIETNNNEGASKDLDAFKEVKENNREQEGPSLDDLIVLIDEKEENDVTERTLNVFNDVLGKTITTGNEDESVEELVRMLDEDTFSKDAEENDSLEDLIRNLEEHTNFSNEDYTLSTIGETPMKINTEDENLSNNYQETTSSDFLEYSKNLNTVSLSDISPTISDDENRANYLDNLRTYSTAIKKIIGTPREKKNTQLYLKNGEESTEESTVLHTKVMEQISHLLESKFEDEMDTSTLKYSKSTEASRKIIESSDQITFTDSHVVVKGFTKSDLVTRAFMISKTDSYDENMMTGSDIPDAKSQGMYSSGITAPSNFSFDSTSDGNGTKYRPGENIFLKSYNNTAFEPKNIFETNSVTLKFKQTTEKKNASQLGFHRIEDIGRIESEDEVLKEKNDYLNHDIMNPVVSVSPRLQTDTFSKLPSLQNELITKVERSKRDLESNHSFSTDPAKNFNLKIIEDMFKNKAGSQIGMTATLSSTQLKPYVYNAHSYFIRNSTFLEIKETKKEKEKDSQDQVVKLQETRKNLRSPNEGETANTYVDKLYEWIYKSNPR